MSDDIDWLQSRRRVCKVELYSPTGQKDQDRKVICFVDVSTLNVEDKDKEGGPSSEGELDLEISGEKEIIVIKDTEKLCQSKTEGSVCLFKQAPLDPIRALSCLLNDLQKYSLSFQHALSPSSSSCKHKIGAPEDGYCSNSNEDNCYRVYADELSTDYDYVANNPHNLRFKMAADSNQSSSSPPAKSPRTQRAVTSPDGECSTDDLSSYVKRLSSLVIQMVRKDIKEKREGGSKCLHYSNYACTGDKGKNSPRSAVSKVASEMAHDVVEGISAENRGPGDLDHKDQKTFLYSELSNKSKGGEEQMCQRDSKEFANSISKRLMAYASQMASDMMVSALKTLEAHSSGKPIPAYIVLQRVLSDLIDSCMKNLHNITGVLMTDSEFVSDVKKILFNQGKQNAANIMEAMLKRLDSTLLGAREKKETESQSLAYASLKAESHDAKNKNQSLEFSDMKAEMMKGKEKGKMKPDQCKSLTGAEKVSEQVLKESLTMWNQKQTGGGQTKMHSKAGTSREDSKREKISPSTDSLAKDLIVSALTLIQYHLTQQAKGKDVLEEPEQPGSTMGCMVQGAHYEKTGSGQSAKALSMKHLESQSGQHAGPSTSPKELDTQKLDMSNIVLMLIQKLLNESPFSLDDQCESESKRAESKPKVSSSTSKCSDRGEEHSHDHQEFDFISGKKQVNQQFVDQLVESVMKLCVIMAKYSHNGAGLAELQELGLSFQAGSSRCAQDAMMSHSRHDNPGPEVIVNNQSSTSNLKKQLQAVLQWIAASQLEVPMLYFMGDEDGQLEKLPEVSAKAAEKGYSVGDLLQEVMKFAKEQQLDEAVGNMARRQLLDWLLTNL
ncbi:A-kinase anchor protein 4-like isoform X1 [Vombatus ursinus]|uniref:A-kinase anchor protein 4-like isoform X1 n=1 Tax=Vombatus ursinus TaxID=29139 RepID=UPI000FFD4EEE|nr:A-kinase anchor protein 4-like isoform X1 [Vombatus ursinus]XP_027714489.1 A-kinase anchor protein 4-like isoform X1 [Vombatus ursinus]